MGVWFLRNRLHVQGAIENGHLIVLGCHRYCPSNENLMRLALWNYVLYRTFNHIRCSENRQGCSKNLDGVMEQYLRDAISGHDGASTFVRNCWKQDYRIEGHCEAEGNDGMDAESLRSN